MSFYFSHYIFVICKKHSPKISVIVPIYNVSEFLDECIISIIEQTYTNLEIILVDDGSTDDCGIKNVTNLLVRINE